MSKPKILFYDIETSPNLAHVWGMYEQNVLAFQKEREMLSFSYKWLGDRSVTAHARPDFKDKTDKSLLKKLWGLFNEADVVVAHYGDGFDNKVSNARFAIVGLPPPKPYQTVDTKKVASKHFLFNSNKLDDLGRVLGVGRKMKNPGIDMWLGCLEGKKSAWAQMVKYNKQDVVLLEKVYLKLLPWINNHPNVSTIRQSVDGCRNCGSKRLRSRGWENRRTNTYVSYTCKDCGTWCRSRQAVKLPKVKAVLAIAN